MLPVLRIGPFVMRTPGLVLLVALWFGIEAAIKEGARREIEGDRLYKILLYALLAGMAGARLGFVLLNLPLYLSITPWLRALGSVVSIVTGTELLWVGLLVALGVAVILARRWRISLLPLADACAPGAAIMIAGAAIAALLRGSYYGAPTMLPWSIDLWGASRHPTQVYLALAALGIFYLLRRLSGDECAPGVIAQIFLIASGAALLLIEPLRADSSTLFGSYRVLAVWGLVSVLLGVGGFAYRAPQRRPERGRIE